MDAKEILTPKCQKPKNKGDLIYAITVEYIQAHAQEMLGRRLEDHEIPRLKAFLSEYLDAHLEVIMDDAIGIATISEEE